MNIKAVLFTSMAVTLSLLNGCSHAPLTKAFNEPNANNIAVQTVNATAGKKDAEPTTLDGQKSERLLERYREDTGKVPREVLVTKVAK